MRECSDRKSLYNGTPLDSAYTMVGNDDYVIPAGEK